jgi:hypothetical protein
MSRASGYDTAEGSTPQRAIAQLRNTGDFIMKIPTHALHFNLTNSKDRQA